jgi:hypothetical protein
MIFNIADAGAHGHLFMHASQHREQRIEQTFPPDVMTGLAPRLYLWSRQQWPQGIQCAVQHLLLHLHVSLTDTTHGRTPPLPGPVDFTIYGHRHLRWSAIFLFLLKTQH